jgi:N-acetylneuraminate lyase
VATLSGLIAAPHTPMDAQGTIQFAVIEKQAEWLVRSGVSGAFICGTTGEGLSLTVDERKHVADRWFQVAGDQLKVIVHVGHDCVADAVELAGHAAAKGAFATSAMAPPFFKPGSIPQLMSYLKPIAAASRNLPFFYYHIPSMTGVGLSMVDFLKAGGELANLAGIKYTHNNMMEYQQCVALSGDRYEISFGQDENLLAALALGANSAVGSTYNYAAPLYLRMTKAFRENNLAEAQACSRKVVAMVDLLIKFGVLAAGKALMSRVGVDCGSPRVPVQSLSTAQLNDLFEAIDKLEVLKVDS